MNKALLYVRVSSKEQEDGYSLDAQEKLGYEYAGRKNLKIVRLWKVSESAWKQERKAFGQMVDFAKRHNEIEHIIFDVLDRMTRNDFDKLKIHRLIRQHGKTIHFSRSNKIINSESGPDEEFMFDIEAAVAKKLSNDISRKAAMGMREKAEQGVFPSVAPIGYLNNPMTHQIDVDPERAPYIQRMFALMATGNYSVAMIRNILTEEGLRSKKGCVVSKNGVGTFINNPVYYGAFRWNGKMYQGSHTPLITKDLFDKAQAVMHGRYHPALNKRGFAFNSLLCCGACGCKIVGEIKKARFIYYHCTFSKGRHYGKWYFPEKKLAERLEEPVRKITLSEDVAEWLAEALREAQKDSTRFQVKQMENLKQEYAQIKSRLSHLYDAKFDGEIGGEMFKAKEIEYNDRLVEIRSRMEKAEGINPNFYDEARETLELSKRLYPQYVKSTYEEKSKILKLVASNYTVDDVTIGYKYRKPFSYFYEKGSRTKWLPEDDSGQNFLKDEFDFKIHLMAKGQKQLIVQRSC